MSKSSSVTTLCTTPEGEFRVSPIILVLAKLCIGFAKTSGQFGILAERLLGFAKTDELNLKRAGQVLCKEQPKALGHDFLSFADGAISTTVCPSGTFSSSWFDIQFHPKLLI